MWLNNNCIGTSSQSEGIENITELVDAWKDSHVANCRFVFLVRVFRAVFS